jgi:DNA-binding response OmpR family regulator
MEYSDTAVCFDWSNKTILVAEDHRLSYILLKTMIERHNAKVIWAQNGEEAVQHFLNHGHIDLVIMDYMMPKLNGIEAAKLIKEHNCNVPVIFHSANDLDEDDLGGIPYNDISYCRKASDPNKLMAKVDNLLHCYNIEL